MTIKYNYKQIEKNSVDDILLSTIDINNIMQQYNDNNFHFIPTSPIDFDTWERDNKYVRNDIRLFHKKLNEYIKNKKNIGFIFNTEPHTHKGKHWVSLYIDTRPRVMKIFYFDSFGSKPPVQIQNLISRIITESKNINKQLTYVSTDGIRRQKSKTECGMYCVYMLINLALKKKSINYFIDKSKNIPNRIVYNFRNKVFIK